MARFAGLILAGGEGTRWGGPKAWAELPDGRTFLESCFRTLDNAGAHPVVATLPPQIDQHPIEGLVVVPLPEAGLDMFASLKVGLSQLVDYPDWSAAAVLPVDHPLVKPETIADLMVAGGNAAIPSFNGKHGHPVSLARSVVQAIVAGESTGPTLRDVLRSITVSDVPVEDPGVISNCNTPEALHEALSRT